MSKKSGLCKLIFKLLVKGINGANLFDFRVNDEIKTYLPPNFSVCLSIFPEGEYVTFKINENHVSLVKENVKPDLKIIFKNRKIAKKVLLGKMSIAKCFSNHALLVEGDIYKAMVLVRIINIVENYLFPRFYTKAIPYVKKEVSAFKMYAYVLFGCSKKERKVVKNEK